MTVSEVWNSNQAPDPSLDGASMEIREDKLVKLRSILKTEEFRFCIVVGILSTICVGVLCALNNQQKSIAILDSMISSTTVSIRGLDDSLARQLSESIKDDKEYVIAEHGKVLSTPSECDRKELKQIETDSQSMLDGIKLLNNRIVDMFEVLLSSSSTLNHEYNKQINRKAVSILDVSMGSTIVFVSNKSKCSFASRHQLSTYPQVDKRRNSLRLLFSLLTIGMPNIESYAVINKEYAESIPYGFGGPSGNITIVIPIPKNPTSFSITYRVDEEMKYLPPESVMVYGYTTLHDNPILLASSSYDEGKEAKQVFPSLYSGSARFHYIQFRFHSRQKESIAVYGIGAYLYYVS